MNGRLWGLFILRKSQVSRICDSGAIWQLPPKYLLDSCLINAKNLEKLRWILVARPFRLKLFPPYARTQDPNQIMGKARFHTLEGLSRDGMARKGENQTLTNLVSLLDCCIMISLL